MITDVGETWESTPYEVRNTDGDLADAGSVTFVVTLPDGTSTTPAAATNIDVGQYVVTYPTTVEGQHQIAVTATGGVLGGQSQVWRDVFTVERARLLVSVDEARQHLAASQTIVTPDDVEQLRWLIHVATDAVERDLGRTLVRRTVTEMYSAERPVLVLRTQPAIEVLSVTVDGTARTVDTFALNAFGFLTAQGGWGSLLWHGGRLQVTYVAGPLGPVPPVARKVCLNGVQRMWQRSQQVPLQYADQLGDEAVGVAAGTLTPLELDAYRSLRLLAIA